MTVESTCLPGVSLLTPRLVRDLRGFFFKPFQQSCFQTHGLAGEFREAFFTQSQGGVIRGMHYQAPPHDHDKLVFVLAGTILDVVLDLRGGTPTYGRHLAIELSEAHPRALYIPRGLAHGFAALSAGATVGYLVTEEHAATHDCGVRYDSFGFTWPLPQPVVSPRDLALPSFDRLDTPFGPAA